MAQFDKKDFISLIKQKKTALDPFRGYLENVIAIRAQAFRRQKRRLVFHKRLHNSLISVRMRNVRKKRTCALASRCSRCVMEIDAYFYADFICIG